MPRKESVDHESREWIVRVLEAHMAKAGLTQAEVSRRTGIGESTISQLLHGRVKGLGLDQVLKLHRGLHISGDLLLGEPDWKRYAPPRSASPSAQPGRQEATGGLRTDVLNARSRQSKAAQ